MTEYKLKDGRRLHDYGNIEEDEKSEHYNTCTHRLDGCVLVRDAENIAVFWAPRRNIFHYSIRLRDWYSCSTVPKERFEEFENNPDLEMKYIQGRVRDLRSLHQM